MKKSLNNIIVLVLIISMGSSGDITLSISSIEDDGIGNIIIDLYMKNEVPVSQFQFQIITEPDSIITFYDFCSDNNYSEQLNCTDNGHIWHDIPAPDVVWKGIHGSEIRVSPKGSFLLMDNTGNAINVGEGILTRITGIYDITNIGTIFQIVNKAGNSIEYDCDPSQDGTINIIDSYLLFNYILNGIDVTSAQLECMDMNNDNMVTITDYIVFINILLTTDNYELIFTNSDNEKIEDVEFTSQNWLVGQGILVAGCMNEAACNYNGNANYDDGNCSNSPVEFYDCDGNCIAELDECGVCGGGGKPDGECDCDGNVLDACNNCGGDCMTDEETEFVSCSTSENNTVFADACGLCGGEGVDADNDGSCDDIDDCVSIGQENLVYDVDGNEVGDPFLGGYDECGVCGGTGAEEGFDCNGELSLYNERIPKAYNINNIYPNPFNPLTNITYSLHKNVNVQIIIYDLSGKQVQILINEFQTPGYHTIYWNASSYPSGVYLIRMDSGEFTQTQKVVLVK